MINLSVADILDECCARIEESTSSVQTPLLQRLALLGDEITVLRKLAETCKAQDVIVQVNAHPRFEGDGPLILPEGANREDYPV